MIHYLNDFLNICYRHIRIPKQWRHANVISLLKPGKRETSSRSYHPISLLCTTYKLLERIVLTQIEPIVEKILPKEQAGFQKGCSTLNQVVKLTETIEDAFDKKEIMRSVFIDLTAASSTVWHQGLRVKLQRILTSNHLINFIIELLYTRCFNLFTSDKSRFTRQKSWFFRLKNGVAQGSVLAPILYNIYTADFPKTSGNCFMYTDDVAVTYSASSIAKVEENLSTDIKTICQYLHDRHLKLSQSKTVSSLFHLKNHLASKSIKVTLDPNTILNCERYPTYPGLKSNIQKPLAQTKTKSVFPSGTGEEMMGTNWGASFDTLRTSTTALVFAPAEYCTPVWFQSTHTKRLDVPLKETVRIASGCIRPTPLNFLPSLLGIQSPSCRRKKLCKRLYYKADNTDHLLHNILYSKTPPKRLKSRKSLHPFLESLQGYGFQQEPIPHKLQPHIQDWSSKPLGQGLPRKAWVQLNGLRTGIGKFGDSMVKWGFGDDNLCQCGEPQTAYHIVNDCKSTGPPCNLTDVDNPMLKRYLISYNF